MSENGTWERVTDASQVNVGDRVRYSDRSRFGYEEDNELRTIIKKEGGIVATEGCSDLFKGTWKIIEVFRPAVAKPPTKSAKRKVAKVVVLLGGGGWKWFLLDEHCDCVDCGGSGYSSRRCAIRGAHRFFNRIGTSCQIVKEY